MESRQSQRKNEHLSLASKYYDAAHANHPFDQVRLIHNALPEKAVADIKTTTELLPGLRMAFPFYLEAMTGGSAQAEQINRQLAHVAAKHRLAMATGSASIALKNPTTRASFSVVRDEDPNGIIIANLSAKATVAEAKKAIELLRADALELHLNAAQELIMPEGDRSFYWLENIRKLTAAVPVPVIVKEVGFGMTKDNIIQLSKAGVKAINISGRGGTNFAMIENRRNHQEDFSMLADWGQTTPEALLEARATRCKTAIIASGGITSPLDVIKAGVLGARSCGVAGYFLNILVKDGVEKLDQVISDWKVAITRLLTLLGVSSYTDLVNVDCLLSPNLLSYISQRKLK